jgi:thiamine biosynthesis lipoprotein
VAVDPPSVRIPDGIALDLGATAKALAADRAVRAAYRATGVGVLVSLGGDVATCGPPPVSGWPVRVTDDHRDATRSGQLVHFAGGGLATSSVTTRRWSHAGAVRHHILDPRTGAPVGGRWRTVSVLAATCAGANTASTAALVLGDEAPAWLSDHGLAARLVTHSGGVHVLGGWPA